MKLSTFKWIGIGGLIATLAWGQPPAKEAAPADGSANRPALPAGHPDISGAGQSPKGGLPPGHPEIPGAASGGLPAGHPDIFGKGAATQPATSGTLTIVARQGTEGGPPLGTEPAVVSLYHQGKVIGKVEATLDQQGVAVVDNLPLALPFQPLVTVRHAGVEYQAVGSVMDGRRPSQQIDVAVYETTETAPAWHISMRHVIIEPVQEGLRVVDVLAIENPTDRTWLGAAGADGKRETISLAIPPGAQHLQVSGASENCCDKSDGRVIHTAPMVPGTSQLQFSYIVPPQDGRFRLSFEAPAGVKHAMLFIAADAAALNVQGLESAGAHAMGKSTAQIYKGKDLKAGHETTVVITDSRTAAAPNDQAQSHAGTAVPKVIAAAGAGAILVVGTGLMLLKAPKSAKR